MPDPATKAPVGSLRTLWPFVRRMCATGPVRAHLDLGTDDLPAEVRRLVALGAEDLAPGRGWHVLRDPAGLAFCATLNPPDGTDRRDLG